MVSVGHMLRMRVTCIPTMNLRFNVPIYACRPNTPGYYKHLGSHTEESCTQYNALKVARHMFQWSADAKLADFYERAFLNGILGNENLGANQPPGTIDLEYG